MGQNTSNSVWKPCEDLQKTFDLCHCQQRVYNKVLRWNFVIDQILIFHHNLQINSLKILQCDCLDLFLILSLIVEVYLWWKLQASLIFLSGRTCTIGGWLNTFLPHCTSHLCLSICTGYQKLLTLNSRHWVCLQNHLWLCSPLSKLITLKVNVTLLFIQKRLKITVRYFYINCSLLVTCTTQSEHLQKSAKTHLFHLYLTV